LTAFDLVNSAGEKWEKVFTIMGKGFSFFGSLRVNQDEAFGFL
jgi:hypothetical protein